MVTQHSHKITVKVLRSSIDNWISTLKVCACSLNLISNLVNLLDLDLSTYWHHLYTIYMTTSVLIRLLYVPLLANTF